MTTPLVQFQQKSFEWYTPKKYIDAVVEVLGNIDLDPASNVLANTVVGASVFYDRSVDGLTCSWPGRVFLNPPYCKNQSAWISRLIAQYEAGTTTQAILLVHASTDTGWFQLLWNYPICFTHHRIHFWTIGKQTGPTHGSAFVYFGSQKELFSSVFSRFGAVVVRAAAPVALSTLWGVQ